MSAREGPPKREPGPLGKEAGPQRSEVTTANRGQLYNLPATFDLFAANLAAEDPRGLDEAIDHAAERAVLHRQLHARRLAAARSLRLACGCREPMPHQCRPQRLSLDSAIAAREHLTALGLEPIFDPDTERALRLARLTA